MTTEADDNGVAGGRDRSTAWTGLAAAICRMQGRASIAESLPARIRSSARPADSLFDLT